MNKIISYLVFSMATFIYLWKKLKYVFNFNDLFYNTST